MEIWKILGIEPTTDKGQIRKAYALRSREIHPEEKPEEFRLLHEAYQRAAAYAETLGKNRQDGGKAFGAERPPHMEGAEAEEASPAGAEQDQERDKEPELCSYFAARTKDQEEKILFFREKWKELPFERFKEEVQEWWKDYLSSAEFQEIRWHPELLKLLAEEMEKHLQYDYEIRLYFWDAYGFEEEGAFDCKGDLQTLRRALYSAYERRHWKQEKERREQEEEALNRKSQKFLAWMLLTAFGVACFLLWNKYIG